MVHGKPQHNGKQTGTTAIPFLVFVWAPLSDPYMYLPEPLAYSPCNKQNIVNLIKNKVKTYLCPPSTATLFLLREHFMPRRIVYGGSCHVFGRRLLFLHVVRLGALLMLESLRHFLMSHLSFMGSKTGIQRTVWRL